MEEVEESRYWCHMCSQVVNPIVEFETIKCPFCQSGFVEEMASPMVPGNTSPDFGLGGSDSDRALSVRAPILLGMMGNSRRRPSRRLEFEDDDDGDDYDNSRIRHEGEMELDQLESVLRRRRRNSATVLQLLQGIRAGIASESVSSDIDQLNRGTDNDRDEENMVMINPFNQTIVIRGQPDSANDSQNQIPIGSLGDYLVGPGLDLLLQHLAESDPARYGTPPAQREAVEALITAKNNEIMQCSVCLDDCEIGAEMKELPCRHKFHSECILPWLKLHSSCPVCRHQLPSDESKLDIGTSRNNSISSNENGTNASHGDGIAGDDRNENWRRFTVSLPWPFNSLFSSSTSSQSSSGNSSFISHVSSTNAPHNPPRRDEH